MAKGKGKSQAYKKRPVGNREIRKRFLLICEGTKTEPAYFEKFKTNKVVIEIEGMARDPQKLVKTAIEARDKAKKDTEEFDEVWCVFDRDDVPIQDFNAALSQAAAHDIQVAYSNEAFELWYVLHFEYLNTGIPRKDYQAKIAKYLGLPSYCKNDSQMYDRLKPHQGTAIDNAIRLLDSYQPPNPAKDNPSTTVHFLVKALRG
jgi:hypothetical protein